MKRIFRPHFSHPLAGLLAPLSFLLLVPFATVLPVAAQSSCTATVTSTADTGPGSLRQTIAAVSAASPNGTICITATGTINLGSTLSIPQGLTITGPGTTNGGLTLSGQGKVQDILLPANDSSSGAVTISGLTIANSSGRGLIVGGGVQAILNNVFIQNNAGGGIDNPGQLTITNGKVSNNTTVNLTSNGQGAGIYNELSGTLTLTNVSVDANSSGAYSGGGLDNEGVATITGGDFTGNSGQQGAAISTGITSQDQDAILNVSGGTVFMNNAAAGYGGGGAIYNAANEDNSGQQTNLANQATILDATFAGNSTRQTTDGGPTSGGALYNGDIMVVRESTFTANTADGAGGGILNQGLLTLVQDTITGNTAAGGGSGVAVASYQEQLSITTSFNNTIISGNVTDDCENCGTIPAGNLVGSNAMLGPLAQNGGPAETCMPLPGSAAIIGGVYNPNGLDGTDERGLSRLTYDNDTPLVDIGAVQTHYHSVLFLQQPSSGLATQIITPPVTVQVKEIDGNTINYPQGVPVTMELIPTVGQQPEGSLGGTVVQLPTQASSGVVAAIFNNLTISVAGGWELQATTYPSTQNSQVATYSATSNPFQTTSATPPQVAWAPAALTYGQAVSAAQLDATVSLDGGAATACGASCAYSYTLNGVSFPITAGSTYPAGTYTAQVVYTGANGQSVTLSGVNFVVNRAAPTVSFVSPPAIVPGIPFNKGMIVGTATSANGAVVAGSYSYVPAPGTALTSGSFPVSVTFTPADSTDYAAVTSSQTLSVLAPTATTTTATITPSTAYAGTAETLVVQVLPNVPGVVSGTISSSDGLGTQPLVLLPGLAGFSLAMPTLNFSPSAQMAAYTADLNDDGVADQVVSLGTQLQVLLANPAFEQSDLTSVTLNTYGACYYISGVDIGDVNGDGLPDIVAACQNIGDGLNDGGPIVVFLNQGNGNFAAPVATGGQGSSPMQGASVVLADFNGDGILDLVSLGTVCPYVGAGPCFAYQQGNGDGTFQAATAASYIQLDAGGGSFDTFDSLQTGDFNGDGVPDLAFIHNLYGIGGRIEVWVTNTSAGITFGTLGGSSCYPGPCYDASATVTPGTSGNAPIFLVADDLNGDGIPDLAAVMSDGNTGSGNTLSIALNTPSGNAVSFPASTTDTVYAGAQSLDIGDFNQDGFADIAIATFNGSANTLAIELGDGTGAFTTAWPNGVTLDAPVAGNGAPPLYPTFTVGDANGDGFPDLLLAQPTAANTASGRIAYTFGNTQASFSTTAPSQTTTYTATTAPASKLYSSSTGSATLTVNAAVVTLAWTPAPITYGQTVPATDLAATATVNGAAATGTFVYTFTATGAVINSSTIYPAAPSGEGVQVAFTPTGSTQQYTLGTTLVILQATPALALVAPPVLLPGAKLSTANVHAVVTGVAGSALPGTLAYTPALGSALTSGQAVQVSFSPTDATDYAGVTATLPASSFVVLPANAVTTTLTATPNPALPGAAVALSASVAPAGGASGTVPGMVAFTSPSGAIASEKLALDPLAAKFVAGTPTQVPIFEYNSYTADFNGDGVADLLTVPIYGGAPQLMLSQLNAAGTLGAPIALSLGSACSNGQYVVGAAVGDANGDGLPDIALTCTNLDSDTNNLVVLVNQGAGAFAPATTPLVGVNYVKMAFGDFNGDGKQDLVLLIGCSSDSANFCLQYFPGNGTGSFGGMYSEIVANGNINDTYSNLVTGDFNQDGHLDLAFVHATASTVALNGVVEIWKYNPGTTPSFGNQGTGGYGPDKTITAGTGGTLASLVSADFNQDGLPDLALVTYVNPSGLTNTTSVVLNGSSGGTLTFPSQTRDTTSTAGIGSSLVTADFDGDGIPDLVLYNGSDNTVKVLHGAGDGTFSSTESNLAFTLPAPVATPSEGQRTARSRRGASATGHPLDSLVNNLYYPVLAVGDTNGDGYPDLLVGYVTEDQSGNVTGNGQQFVTSGASLAKTTIAAPATSTVYTATAEPADTYWAGSAGTVSLGAEAVPTQTTLTITGLPATGSPVYGTPLTLTSVVTNVGTATPAAGGSVLFTDNGVAIVSAANPVSIDSTGTATLRVTPTAGQHIFGAVYSGTTGEATSTAPTRTIAVAKFTPTIAWLTPAAITTTTPLSAAQLDATLQGLPGTTLALPGTPVYTPTFGATLPQGTDTLSVVYTPTDTNDYNTVSKSISILVNNTNTKTTFTITPVSATASYTYGQALTLTASVTNTTGSTVIQGGAVTFSSGAGTLASVTVVNGVATLSGVVLTGGTHLIGATYAGEAGEGTSEAAAQTVTITRATPTLTWPTPAPITTATPLSATQLDATANGVTGASLGGVPVYTPGPGSTLLFGTQTLSVVFTPTDTTDYTTATKMVPIQVVASATQTSLAVSSKTSTYGQALTLTATVTNVGETAPVQTGTVTFSQNGVTLSTVPVSNGIATLGSVKPSAGTYVLGATYNGVSGETSSSGTNTVTINKATPNLAWPTPATISSTTPLSAEQLDATAAGTTGAALPGSFAYTPASGTLTVGTHILSTTFTPSDTNDYLTATTTVSINVVATNTVTTFTVAPAASTYGQPLTLTALVANSTGSTVIQTGSVVFASDNVTLGIVGVVNGSASLGGISPTAGSHLITASYNGAAGEGASADAAKTITVAKATPLLTWPTPATISSTTPLSATQLDATAAGVTVTALPGAFVYSPDAGGLLTVGTHTLSVTFTPTDTVNYATASSTVTIKVVPETIALASISPATTTIATTPLIVTLTASGFPSSTVVLLNGAQIASTVLTTSQLSATVPASNLSKTGTLTFTLYDKASQATSNPVSLAVTAPTPSATVTVPPAVTSGDQPTVGLTLAAPYPVDIAGTYTLAFTPSGPNGVDDPAIKFTNGSNTLGFTIPAGQTSAGAASLQTGTVEGTIAINTTLTAGGVDVTPPTITGGTDLTIAPAAPVITGVTLTAGTGVSLTGTGGVGLTDTNGLLTITVTGYSNTREVTEATFTFTGPGAGNLASTQVIVPAVDLFGTWYSNESSATYGSTFSYTQTFQLSDPTTNITGVAVTLANSVGTSASVNSQ